MVMAVVIGMMAVAIEMNCSCYWDEWQLLMSVVVSLSLFSLSLSLSLYLTLPDTISRELDTISGALHYL